MSSFKLIVRDIPQTPGVYLMKDVTGRILYVGKAANLRRRVSSYFKKSLNARLTAFIGKIKKIDYKRTETALEALILEARLIKKHEPLFNIKEKDDKSFLFVEITKEKFPRVLLIRDKNEAGGKRYGPFTSASAIREALKILRKIFPFSVHESKKIERFTFPHMRESEVRLKMRKEMSKKPEKVRPCFDYQLGLCPGVCVHAISRADYLKNIKNIKLFFKGEKKKILENFKKEMQFASRRMEFEKAEKIKRQTFALGHIQDVALINDAETNSTNYSLLTTNSYRIEGYDISNISGASAVGSMVVFLNGKPAKNEYRKFKIRTIAKPNDVGMLKEVLRRRFSRSPKSGGWPLPDLILVDGGRGQVNAAKEIMNEAGLKLPVVGIAKGAKRKNNKFIGDLSGINEKILIKVRDEAHRFAKNYHKNLRKKQFLL